MTNEKELLPSAVASALKLPGVKIDRRKFLAETFSKTQGEELSKIIDYGPQTVFDTAYLTATAKHIVRRDTEKSTVASFLTGLPSNPAVMAGSSAVDIAQYFAFALRMAQEISYIFGKQDLFDNNGDLSENGERDIILYLGVMLGVSAASSAIIYATRELGKTAGKKVASKALTKTIWYPILKKIAAAINITVTKQTVSKTITKVVPVVGGVLSGGLTFITFITFKPMGNRLIRSFAKALNSDEASVSEARDVILEAV